MSGGTGSYTSSSKKIKTPPPRGVWSIIIEL